MGRIEILIDSFELLLVSLLNLGRGQDSPIRGLRQVVFLADSRAITLLRAKLHHRLEEVRIEPQMSIKLVEQFELWLCLVNQIYDIAPYDRIILLFDKTVIVLAVVARTGEGDLLLQTVAQEMIIDKFAAVVRIDPQQIEGQPLTNLEQRFKDRNLSFVAHSHRFCPTRADIGHVQREEIFTIDVASIVRY